MSRGAPRAINNDASLVSKTTKTPGEAPKARGAARTDPPAKPPAKRPTEVGGRKKGLDPTRYGDWEMKGRAVDF